jgi:hypothetical protein
MPPSFGRYGNGFRWVAAGLLALLSACVGPGNRQTIRFDLAPGPVGAEVVERRSYFFWGLVPTARTDVLDVCPAGAVAIRQAPGETGALAWLPTLGLWSSRTTTYLCRPPDPVSSP